MKQKLNVRPVCIAHEVKKKNIWICWAMCLKGMSYYCHRGLDLSFHTAPSKPLFNLLHIVKQVHQEIHSVDHMKLHSILWNDECFLSMWDTVFKNVYAKNIWLVWPRIHCKNGKASWFTYGWNCIYVNHKNLTNRTMSEKIAWNCIYVNHKSLTSRTVSEKIAKWINFLKILCSCQLGRDETTLIKCCCTLQHLPLIIASP